MARPSCATALNSHTRTGSSPFQVYTSSVVAFLLRIKTQSNGCSHLDISSFQTDDQRDLQPDFLNGCHDPLGDHITTHDTPKDIDKNALDGRVRGDDFERLCDLLSS